jgi:hypothetical protein
MSYDDKLAFQVDANGKHRIFYVCSYGGSGSKMLCKYLTYFGTVYHIHSRKPPDRLEYVGGDNCYFEWFNGIPISKEDLEKNTYIVIYIYRDPIKAIHSRFWIPQHLDHIQTKNTNNWENVIKEKSDLWGINEFYQNYTTPNKNRNYTIHCLRYDTVFKYIHDGKFNRYFGLSDIDKKYKPKQKETKREYKIEDVKIFDEIYHDLQEKMKEKDWVFVA